MRNLFGKEAPRGMSLANTSELSVAEQPQSELVALLGAMIQMLQEMVRGEEGFIRIFFNIQEGAGERTKLIEAIFSIPRGSLVRKVQEKLMLAANLVEVAQLLGNVAQLASHSADNTEDACAQRVVEQFSSVIAPRLERLILLQVKSLDSALARARAEATQTTIHMVARRFCHLIVDFALSTSDSHLDCASQRKVYLQSQHDEGHSIPLAQDSA